MSDNPLLDADVAALFLGEFIGSGVARTVYRHGWDNRWVVKVQRGAYDFQNQAEWDLWQATGPELEKWLAPCIAISPHGHALIQAYCEPCPTHMIPTKVPGVLGDLHDKNWGVFEGRAVACDYGRSLAFHMANNARAMRLISREKSLEPSS